MFHRPIDLVLEVPFIWKCLSRHARGLWGPLVENFSEWRGACGASARELKPRCAPNQLIRRLTLCIATTNWAVYIRCPAHLLILCHCCFSPCCSTSCCFLCIHSPPPCQHLPAGSIYLCFPRELLLIPPFSCFSWSKNYALRGEAKAESDARVKSAFAFILNKTDE